ncbi:EF-hand domain-containing protein [Novosphingobium flavum]|uniref:EF-hand domain-containing protein n=1 Tax=Novosphingobium flavum TaxID=1778672 RepID=A0A7X1FPZ3_9SPHN|nr:EF-hand domain-containing protein [Novosphingobium flavum]MBC2664382.1 EF-hand domain-containing protein [Novosphingobium flavum]
MKKITLALSAAALGLAGTVAGVAVAQQAARPDRPMMQDPFGNATVTRAEAQAKALELFARLDANKDGKIDKADREIRRSVRLDEMFAKLDTNKDGKIDKAEFAAAHQPGAGPMDGMRGMHRMGPGPMMGRMDGNGDKAVTRDEFVAGALKRFDAADANKDGKLTPEERRAAMRQHMGDRGGRHGGGHRGGPMGGPGMTPPPPPPAQ